MSISIFWFRNDYRLTDNPALLAACRSADRLVLLVVISADESQNTSWGFPRWGKHRRTFRDQALEGLKIAVAECGGELLIIEGSPADVIPALALKIGADRVFCEAIAAPEEIAEIAALRNANLNVSEHWQSRLLDPAVLPFGIEELPEVFTVFRHVVERTDPLIHPPTPAPGKMPPTPVGTPLSSWVPTDADAPPGSASFPFDPPRFMDRNERLRPTLNAISAPLCPSPTNRPAMS